MSTLTLQHNRRAYMAREVDHQTYYAQFVTPEVERMVRNYIGEDKIKDIDKEIRQVVAESADFAESAPEPELSELYTDVLVEQY